MSSHNFQAGFVKIPSELYKHLNLNYGSCRPESFIRTLWIKQLPPEVQVVLAAFQDKSVEELTAVADSVMRVIERNPKKNDISYRDLLLLQRIDMLSDKVEKLTVDVRRILEWKTVVDGADVEDLGSQSVLKSRRLKNYHLKSRIRLRSSSAKARPKSRCVMKPQKEESASMKMIP